MRHFSKFFADNYTFVVGVAERRLSSRSDAEEVAADAFRIAWQRWEMGEELTVPWLYGVVRNLIGNEYRSRLRRIALTERAADEHQGLRSADVDLEIDMQRAIERLPADFREVIVMTYWDGLSSTEAAAVLEVSAMAVRTRLVRARKLLKEAFAFQEPHEGGRALAI